MFGACYSKSHCQIHHSFKAIIHQKCQCKHTTTIAQHQERATATKISMGRTNETDRRQTKANDSLQTRKKPNWYASLFTFDIYCDNMCVKVQCLMNGSIIVCFIIDSLCFSHIMQMKRVNI